LILSPNLSPRSCQPRLVDIQTGDVCADFVQLVGDEPRRAPDVKRGESRQVVAAEEMPQDTQDFGCLLAPRVLVEHLGLQVRVRKLPALPGVATVHVIRVPGHDTSISLVDW